MTGTILTAAFFLAAASAMAPAAVPQSAPAAAARQAPFGCIQDPEHHDDAVDCQQLRYAAQRWRVRLPTILRAGPSVDSMKVVALKRGASTTSEASSTIAGRTWMWLKTDEYQGWVQQAVLTPRP